MTKQRVDTDGIDIGVEIKVINPMGETVDGNSFHAFRYAVGIKGGEERHVVLVIIKDWMTFYIVVYHVATAVELELIFGFGELIELVAVDKVVLSVGTEAVDGGDEAVEIVCRWLEFLVEVKIVVFYK